MFEEENAVVGRYKVKNRVENELFEYFMKNMRYIFRGILLFLGLLVVGRAMYRFVAKNENLLSRDQEKPISIHEKKIEKDPQHPIEVSYNFKKLIKLIDESSKIKWTAFPSFDELQKRQGIDRKTVAELLKELLHERVKLRNYILDLKGCSSTGVPIKRYRSLLYYLEVLENNITDMRNLMKKEELFKKSSSLKPLKLEILTLTTRDERK